MGTGLTGRATAAATSPAMPLPPMPTTTTEVTSSAEGSGTTPRSSAASAPATCSGSPYARSNMPRLSSRSGRLTGTPVVRRWPSSSPGLLERRADALGLGLGEQAGVLVVADRLRLVDEHHRDAVPDGI